MNTNQLVRLCWLGTYLATYLTVSSPVWAQRRPGKPTAPARPATSRPAPVPVSTGGRGGFTAQPGVGGIFVAFGAELPKTFRYRLERSTAGTDAYVPVAETGFPRLPEQFTGRLDEAVAQLPSSYLRMPKRSLSEARYHVLRRNATTDSLASLMVIPHYQIAAGLGFWDNTAQPGIGYDYRLSRLNANGSSTPLGQLRSVTSPGSYPKTVLRLDTAYATGPTVSLEYELVSGRAPEVLHVFRAYHLRSEFEQVVASYYPIRSANGRVRYRVTDATVVDKLAYSYYVMPGDYVGNRGEASASYNVYNARPNEVTFLPERFRVRSIKDEKRLRLSWRISPSKEITSVDIFRGNDFDKSFVRIGSVGATDTVFYDRNVEPVRTYFYTLIVNTIYGKSFPSARVPALLEAVEPNYSRPENLRVQQNGRALTFTWNRPAGPITGYYLYRARNYDQVPERIGKLIDSKAATVTVTDSLPAQGSDLWVYSVASINSSYNLSPLSERVTISPAIAPRPPAELTVRLRDVGSGGHAANLVWTNQGQAAQQIGGANVYRRLVPQAPGKSAKLADWQLLNKTLLGAETNFWTDTTVREGSTYAYMVRTLGTGGGLSNPSPEARCTVAETYPAGVRNVRLLQSGTGVLMQWDAPFDPTIERLVVYRAESGKPLQKLTTLPRSAAQFIDKTPLAKKTNYYQILAEDRQGHASRNPDLVGLYVE
ncbi:fibronectin type III domain-containing protein [Fibrella forsythiae]|uniref:Fibronectin type-III domain-containing protein n=1 Tax=Fibrella forsythiae TaxID=2817061 RepID=A0ABS3JSL6_9BACT|nr:hypothetical protein [Fibrella forsythiae]MBO0952973.1 hypothetical protein [Fibrella forsythiae]